ncbi:LOW QUALITY PROTEIN: O-methyltransferase COMT-type [Trema orientale]|uniref:O-methyltransferase COMT-type n=1 Tax=Trema orientale TaxID=63057 RepID=A0A2P5E7Q1_TREOI|nr:LOW QUALITY PROTEIN: O-methyltransferase COMT-type [Trema orientale]
MFTLASSQPKWLTKANYKMNKNTKNYSLTNTTRLLLSEAPAFMKMKPLFLFHLLPEAMAPWHTLSTWLKNGDISAFETAEGRTFWDCLADEPSLNHIFNEAMASDSQLIAKVTLEEYKEVFEGLKSLVDVGGGTGTMAKAVANKFPNVTCTVFDLPHVVSDLQGSSEAGLITFIGGNVFSDPIPPADAILLKVYIHA